MTKEQAMTKDGGPAFPFTEVRSVNKVTGATISQVVHEGLSIRDWFAGRAMQGFLANGASDDDGDGSFADILEPHEMAEEAYRFADAMLAERTRTQEQP